jgi:hypothetical protein
MFLLVILAASALAQAPNNLGSLHGQVTDPSGAVVIGASVTVTTPSGQSQSAVTDKQGNYVVRDLPAGDVTVNAAAPGFTPYQMPNVIISASQSQQLDIAFSITAKPEQVTVQSENSNVDVNPANNASATILKGQDLEALSDDPDELEQDLLALAGPSVGPNGGQIYIDGFSNGTLPPKDAIREVRINQNPFSAAYDRPGFGRVEVFTKPGSDKWHGQLMFNERNSTLNSRNPYVLADIPPYHTERYSGNVSGALTKKVSLFFNVERRDINELSAVDAFTLDPNGDPIPTRFTQAVPSPETRTNLSPRIDWQLTPTNTLTARYQFLKNDELNQGFGGFSLASRADTFHQTQHTVQISDTQVLSSHVINETRFQLIRDDTANLANNPNLPALNVLGEFNGGGSTVGQTTDTISRYELQNYTSWSVGKHFVKFGGRLRVSQDDSLLNANYNGSFTYSGIPAIGSTPAITPLQTYKLGLPSQFSIVQVNDPTSKLTFADVGLYAEDDWKLRPNLTFSYGMRFESQSAIANKANFEPRLGLSWGLGKANSVPKTVLRLGYGIFYDRFTQDLVQQTLHLNGVAEQQFVLSDPTGLPCNTVATCKPLSASSTTVYQINPNLHAPYTSQSAVSLERQLGSVGTVSFTYLNTRGVHQLILINANAPNAPDYSSKIGNVYQYDSEAIFKQNQLITNVQIRLSQKFSILGFYALGYANSDSGGASSNPSNSFHLTQDYGRAAFDIRNRLFISGTATLAHSIRISPFVVANSGTPFNITTGNDFNGDSFYNDRPAFATSTTPTANILHGFDINKADALAHPIPVNYGKGPANVTVNLRVSKTFGFGADTKKPNASGPDAGQRGPGGGGRGGPGGGGGFGRPSGMGGIFGPSSTTRRFNLTVAAMARNLLNTWNPGLPTGNLSSSNFGKANALAGGPFSSGSTANRIFDLSLVFAF